MKWFPFSLLFFACASHFVWGQEKESLPKVLQFDVGMALPSAPKKQPDAPDTLVPLDLSSLQKSTLLWSNAHAYSVDGEQVAILEQSKGFVFSTRTGKLLFSFQKEGFRLSDIRATAKGHFLAWAKKETKPLQLVNIQKKEGSTDDTLIEFDAAGQIKTEIHAPGRLPTWAVSPSGDAVAVVVPASNPFSKVDPSCKWAFEAQWNLARTNKDTPICPVLLTKAVAAPWQIQVWTLNAPQKPLLLESSMFPAPSFEKQGSSWGLHSIQFSPQGHSLVVSYVEHSLAQDTARSFFYNAQTGSLLADVAMPGTLASDVAFSNGENEAWLWSSLWGDGIATYFEKHQDFLSHVDIKNKSTQVVDIPTSYQDANQLFVDERGPFLLGQSESFFVHLPICKNCSQSVHIPVLQVPDVALSLFATNEITLPRRRIHADFFAGSHNLLLTTYGRTNGFFRPDHVLWYDLSANKLIRQIEWRDAKLAFRSNDELIQILWKQAACTQTACPCAKGRLQENSDKEKTCIQADVAAWKRKK